MFKKIITLAGVFAIMAGSVIAQTQQVPSAQCGPYEDVHRVLTERYGEAVVGLGLTSNQQYIVSTYVNIQTDTFSVVITDLAGLSCLILEGGGWQIVPPVANGDEM